MSATATVTFRCGGCGTGYAVPPAVCIGCGRALRPARAHRAAKGLQAMSSRERRRKRMAIVGRYGWTCWICLEAIDPHAPRNSRRALSLDHVVKVADGGENKLENLRPAHRECNSERAF